MSYWIFVKLTVVDCSLHWTANWKIELRLPTSVAFSSCCGGLHLFLDSSDTYTAVSYVKQQSSYEIPVHAIYMGYNMFCSGVCVYDTHLSSYIKHTLYLCPKGSFTLDAPFPVYMFSMGMHSSNLLYMYFMYNGHFIVWLQYICILCIIQVFYEFIDFNFVIPYLAIPLFHLQIVDFIAYFREKCSHFECSGYFHLITMTMYLRHHFTVVILCYCYTYSWAEICICICHVEGYATYIRL